MKRNKITCSICNKEYSKSNFGRHYDKCSGTNSYFPPAKTDKWYKAMEIKKGTTARNHFSKSKELGLPSPKGYWTGKVGPTKGCTLTQEHKDKISKSRIKFLSENPHMVPYKLNHYSKGRSYAEEYWKTILDSNNLIYEEQYQIGPYQLDFAFLDDKIDLEIDGDQHHLDPKIVASDNRRNEYLENLGWKIIRIKWSDYQKLVDKQEFVSYIIKELAV
jgi:very-short-patch-repair endonuclease